MKSVYFLKPIGMDGPVKIGCSKQPQGRLQTLDIWSPFPLELMAIVPGDHKDERALHWHFRDSRLHGEWFAWTTRLHALIRRVKANGSLPPLEVAPYGKTGNGRGNNPGRNHEWSLAKKCITRRVNLAERHAYGYLWIKQSRPARIAAILESYNGVQLPPPSSLLVAELDAYVAELRSRPKCTRDWYDWIIESPERMERHGDHPMVQKRLAEKAKAA